MSRSTALLVTLALPLITGCGGAGDPKEDGFSALQSGDHAGAAERFEAALAAREPADADYVEVAVARCQALAHTDAESAETAFMELAGAHGAKLEISDYTIVIGELQAELAFVQAIHVMHAAVQRYPDSPKLAQASEALIAESEKDPEARSILDSLGYLGDG